MNVTEMVNSTAAAATTNAVTKDVTKSFITPTEAGATTNNVITTALPHTTDGSIIAVVILVILLTVAVLGFLLYRYLCHNKGAYRTTGELAPGADNEDEQHNQTGSEKKEYFI